jgi:hypothetical protein
MLNSRSRRYTITLVAGTLSLIGAAGAFAADHGPRASEARTAQVAIPAKGIAPACLLTPGSPDCKSGIIS